MKPVQLTVTFDGKDAQLQPVFLNGLKAFEEIIGNALGKELFRKRVRQSKDKRLGHSCWDVDYVVRDLAK